MGPPATHTTPSFESLGLYGNGMGSGHGKGGPMSLGVPEKNPYPIIVEKCSFLFATENNTNLLGANHPPNQLGPFGTSSRLICSSLLRTAQPNSNSNSSRSANRNLGG